MDFYVIEGLDGVGKSTLVNNLSDDFNILKTPPELFNLIRNELHYFKNSSLFFYMSSLSYVNEKYDLNNTIIDRYFFSTITQYVSSTTKNLKDIEKYFKLFEEFIVLPKITFFIKLDYEERIKRINNRNKTEKNLDNLSIEYNDFWIKSMENYNLSPKITLDGSLTEEELVIEVKNHIKRLKNG